MKNEMPGIPEAAQSEEKARAFIESIRWPDGPVCPHCGGKEVYRLVGKKTSKNPARKGLLKCKKCRIQFTVTVGSVFANSHISLNKWVMGIFLMTSSKKGMSAHQLHRMLKLNYRSAWFMAHRIRFCMKEGMFPKKLSGTVEVDETFVGGKTKNKPLSPRFREGAKRKAPVIALVQRGGDVRSFPIQRVGAKDLRKAITENVDTKATLMTDEWKAYKSVGREYASHQAVNHSALEYVRGDAYTNTAESYFALLKRGIMGTFHHVSKDHLGRYCDEFAFRWNNRKIDDTQRAINAIRGAEGKRLTYKNPMGNA